jgi:hypothetical protein
VTQDGIELILIMQPDAASSPAMQDDLMQQLHAALRDLPVDGIRSADAGEVPSGARAVDLAAVGALLIKVGPGAVRGVVRGVRNWLNRSSARCVELQVGDNRLSLHKASLEEQERLIEAWLRAIGSGEPTGSE